MCRKILLVLAWCFAANSAVMADGLYAGVGLGIVQIEDEEQNIDFSDSTFGWRLHVGYDINQNFAVEGSYIGSGAAEDEVLGEKVEVEYSAFVTSFIGLIPAGDTARLFGKIGYYSGENEVTAFGVTIDQDSDGFTAGAGIRFDDVMNNFSFRGEFDWYDTDVDTLWSFGIGFAYLFGN